MVSNIVERFIFWSRWLLSPLYVGLVVAMGVLTFKFVFEVWILIQHAQGTDVHQFILDLLALLDLVLLGNLILIVLFAGYENFVSKIEVAEENVDRPYWMGTVDFSGLKIKLIGSLVAISVIELLKDFISLSAEPENIPEKAILWQVIIHLTFVVSGVLFAVMDWISDSRVLKTLSLHTGKAGHESPEQILEELQKEVKNARARKAV
jgi:uncharacterized protein (TIGR00645 family)